GVGGVGVVHGFDTVEAESRHFAVACDRTRRAELRVTALEAMLGLAIEATVLVVGLLVLAAGGYAIARGALSFGGLVAFLGSIGALYEPVRGLAKAMGRLQRGAAGARRVADLFDARSRVVEAPEARAREAGTGEVEFRDVSFGYDRSGAALGKISLKVSPGEMVAIVGPSGAGKSTLMRLLLRLHDPDAGAVLIDGQDIRQVTLASLRRAVTVVF